MKTMKHGSATRRAITAAIAVVISMSVLESSVATLKLGDKEQAVARQQAVVERAERVRQARLALEEGLNYAANESTDRATN